MKRFINIDINNFFTNKGLSNKDGINGADFSGVGSSYPAELLPKTGKITVNNIPFLFYNEQGKYDNLDFFNQGIDIPQGTYKRIHVLGAAENGSFNETILIIGKEKDYKEKLGLSEWILNIPLYDEKVAYRCDYAHSQRLGVVLEIKPIIWHQVVDLEHIKEDIKGIVLGDNPGMHLFSLTLEKDE